MYTRKENHNVIENVLTEFTTAATTTTTYEFQPAEGQIDADGLLDLEEIEGTKIYWHLKSSTILRKTYKIM